MSDSKTTRFQTSAPITIEPSRLTPVKLAKAEQGSANLDLTDDGVVFRTEGWYEVLMEVHWDSANRHGTRFSHTKIPDQEPLHSEAINAEVLAQLSDGRQLLRGNTIFGELLVVGRQHLLHPRQRHAGLGQRPDPDERDHGSRVVAPVARVVARGLGQQPLGVVVAHGPHRDPGVRRELADRQHLGPLFIEVSLPGGSSELAMVRA